MSIPHKCPVCEGRGEIGKRLAQVGAILISAKPQRFRCHGCQSTGIVWDTTFNLNPIQPWTTGDVPMIGGGSITYINGHPSDLHSQWREGCFETYREKCDSCGDYQLGNPGDGCKTPMMHPALVLEPLGYPGGNTCGCPKKGPHTDKCKTTWNPGDGVDHGKS